MIMVGMQSGIVHKIWNIEEQEFVLGSLMFMNKKSKIERKRMHY